MSMQPAAEHKPEPFDIGVGLNAENNVELVFGRQLRFVLSPKQAFELARLIRNRARTGSERMQRRRH
jgi:hypothetical protein